MRELVFQQKLLEKAYFIFKLTGLATAWPASSDKWKVPLVFLLSEELRHLSGATGHCFFYTLQFHKHTLTVTGESTFWTLDSSTRISLWWKNKNAFSGSRAEHYCNTLSMGPQRSSIKPRACTSKSGTQPAIVIVQLLLLFSTNRIITCSVLEHFLSLKIWNTTKSVREADKWWGCYCSSTNCIWIVNDM